MLNTRLKGFGIQALGAGETLSVSSKDFGGGQVQFCVGTDQAIGDTLAIYICDPEKTEVAAVHPGPAISFETDSSFIVKNVSLASVNVIIGLLHAAQLAGGKLVRFGAQAGAGEGGGGGGEGGGGGDGGGSGGGDGGGGCLLPGTPVLMADQTTKPIESIVPGDLVLSVAPQDFAEPWQEKMFSSTLIPRAVKVRDVRAGRWGAHYSINGRLRLTYEHPVLVRSAHRLALISAAGLCLGDQLVTPTGPERVERIERREGEVTTYNLLLPFPHLFVADGVIVHNVQSKS